MTRDLDFQPVFIIGDHRSGTTALYQALARTGAFTVVTAYHVLCYRDILNNFLAGREAEARQELAAEFTRRGLTDRGIDGMPVTPDLPEEYGWVIDTAARPRLRPATRPALVELCRRMRLVGGDRPVLLKNPWDVMDFAYVRAAFRSAKLIFVHRHPLGVMNSQFAATRSLFAARNEYVAMLSPWYRQLHERPLQLRVARALGGRPLPRIVGRHVMRATRYYTEHVDAIPPADRVEVRYEDLCAHPGATIASVLAFLGMQQTAPAAAAEGIRPRGLKVAPEVLDRYRRLQPALAAYCSRHGYDKGEPS